jgi:hypothetical protein
MGIGVREIMMGNKASTTINGHGDNTKSPKNSSLLDKKHLLISFSTQFSSLSSTSLAVFIVDRSHGLIASSAYYSRVSTILAHSHTSLKVAILFDTSYIQVF